MVQGYAISERDYQRIERTIRFAERFADVHFRRRHAVHMFGLGGEGEMPYPSERIIAYTTPFTIRKSLHCRRWLYINNTDTGMGGDSILTTPPSTEMEVGDIYWLSCLADTGTNRWKVSLYPNVGQSIIMPSETVVYGSGRYIRMGALPESNYGYYQLILVCSAANTWIVWAVSSTIIEGP